jgi:glycine cleavage system H protein
MPRPLVFMMGRSPTFLPVDRLYAPNHMWAVPIDGGYRFGFSAYAVKLLGDVRHLEWSVEAPAEVAAGQRIGYVEASKATSDLYAPTPGGIERFNPDVSADATLVNSHPYDAGWLLTILGGDATLLMSPDAYQKHLEAVWPLAQRLLKGQAGRSPT